MAICSPVGTWIRTGERSLEIRARWLPQPRPSPRQVSTPKGCGGCSRDSRRPGSAPPAPYSPLLPPGAIDLASSEGPLQPTPELRVREAPPPSATTSHKRLRNFPVCLRLRSLLRFSELCRRGPAGTSAQPRLASRLPGHPRGPGDPAPRRPNFSRAVCAPQTVELLCQGACWFRGPATLSPSAPPSTYPGVGLGGVGICGTPKAFPRLRIRSLPQRFPSRGLDAGGPGLTYSETPSRPGLFPPNSGAVADRRRERRGARDFVACPGLRVRWPAAAACQRRRRSRNASAPRSSGSFARTKGRAPRAQVAAAG